MGRRSFISSSAIRSMVSAYNRSKREKEFENLIREQSSMKKELPEAYEICSFDMNPTSRVAHIDFIATKRYRRIERYVTRNYEKFPIYGDWNIKTKHIRKTIKLTNEELETLNYSTDPLISSFATEIIERINNVDLIPSWFMKRILYKEKDEKIQKLKSESATFQMGLVKKADKKIALGSSINDEMIGLTQEISKMSKEIGRINLKIEKYEKVPNLFLAIITFGIVSKKNYQRKKIKKINRKKYLEELIGKNDKRIKELQKTNEDLEKEVDALMKEIDDAKEKETNQIQKLNDRYIELISEIEPLPSDVNDLDDSDFIPLKTLIGIKYEKIIGCYIIHNKEFNKYYVGQSKDVIKRVTRDHFSGTEVKNIIFAEDYFKSKYENKADIFEVKIIRLNTKDELDATE